MELIHTCYRITDIDRSVAFYAALGFEERARMPIREEAINVFMGLPGDGDRLELTYNFGVDSYEVGTGYGHIAVTVDDIDSALAALAEQGIEPERPKYQVREGGSFIAFVRDPDGYRIDAHRATLFAASIYIFIRVTADRQHERPHASHVSRRSGARGSRVVRLARPRIEYRAGDREQRRGRDRVLHTGGPGLHRIR